jgi:hypothetical protein
MQKSDLLPIHMEMNEFGAHRIVMRCRTCKEEHTSGWTGYATLSTLVVHGSSYIAATRYFEGTLPTECVLAIQPVYDGGARLIMVISKYEP